MRVTLKNISISFLTLALCHWVAAENPGPPAPAQSPDYFSALARFNRGCALLEQYEYSEASKQFEAVLAQFPDWTAAKFNLGLAYLNMMEDAGGKQSIEKAERLFREVVETHPNLVHGWYCLGLYYEHLGQTEKALEVFQKAYALDSDDPHVAFKLAEAHLSLGQNERAVSLLERATTLDPGFVSAIYRLALQYQRLGKRDAAMKLFERFRALNQAELAGGSFTVRKIYGSAGKYYYALGPDMLPLPTPTGTAKQFQTPFFDPEGVELATLGTTWSAGKIAVQIPGVAVGDLNKDGLLDIVFIGVGNEHGAQVWLADGKGGFSPGESLVKNAISCALGDVDNDGDLDLWLGGQGYVQLFENDGKAQFLPVSGLESPSTGEFVVLHVRYLDIDSDGDLDLYASRFDVEGQPLSPLLFINNRDGTFQEAAKSWGLDGPEFSAVTSCWLDIDNDRDLDLILGSGQRPPVCWINDRAGAFRIKRGQEIGLNVPGVSGITTGDVNHDGRPDLVVLTGGRMRIFLNKGATTFEEDEKFTKQFGKLGGTTAQLADVDNDGDADLFIADAYAPGGRRRPALLLNVGPEGNFVELSQEDPRFLFTGLETKNNSAGVLADFDNDGALDVLWAPLGRKALYFKQPRPLGNWIALELAGTRYKDQKSRSNEAALGARAEVRAGQIFQQWDVGQIAGSTSWAPLRLHFGLASQEEVEWLRIIWPDAVLQSEVSLKANQILTIGEVPRKTSSCPHLFVGTGDHFEFVSDFGGKGGLGYLVAPGVYARPHPREYIPLPAVKEHAGKLICKILEPLEEVVYFDQGALVAIDHPAGTFVLPYELMPVSLEEVPDEFLCFNEIARPIRAQDNSGRDVLALLENIDRRFVGPKEQDIRFVGYAKDFSVILEFSEKIDEWIKTGRRIFFVAHGWVEYSYSQTNFAAWQAGVVLRAPSFDVFRSGAWVEIAKEVGYPAGINHWMTVELTGLLQPGDRLLRIRTNMDLYWDQIFLAAVDSSTLLMQRGIEPSKADLQYRGFPREYTPDGFLPTLLDYSNIDLTLPWKCLPGFYTRFGEVTELVRDRDDAFLIMGPGEELTLEFNIGDLPPLKNGFKRSWFLKTESFCKDMDMHTGGGDRVEPLPYHGMTRYPYTSPNEYPQTPATRRAREIYNTRWIGPAN